MKIIEKNCFCSLVEKCLTDKMKFEKCSSGICAGKYSSYYDNYYFECYSNDQSLIELHLTIHLIFNQNKVDEAFLLRYLCQFNQCNEKHLTQQLFAFIRTDFPLQPMKNAYAQLFDGEIRSTFDPFDHSSLKSTSTMFLLISETNPFESFSTERSSNEKSFSSKFSFDQRWKYLFIFISFLFNSLQ